MCVSCLQVAELQRSRDAAQSEAAERGQMLAQQQQDMALLQVQSCSGLLVHEPPQLPQQQDMAAV